MTALVVLLGKWSKTIFFTAFLVMLATFLVVPRLPRQWDAAIDLTIPVPSRSETTNYEYDGYYALQATDLFSNTLAGWFKSPDFVVRVYAKAKVPLKKSSLRNLEKMFTVKKISGQFVTVAYRVTNEQEASDIGDALVNNIKERVDAFNNNGNHFLMFSVLVGKPMVVLSTRNPVADALVAGLIVLVFGFNAVILADAFRVKK